MRQSASEGLQINASGLNFCTNIPVLVFDHFFNFFYDFYDRTVFYGTIWPSYVQKYHILEGFAWFLKPAGDEK